MIRKEAILEFLIRYKQDWEQQLGVARLGLFGSFARGEATEKSDIDILVSFQSKTGNIHESKQLIRQVLQQQFGRNVDVCNEKYIKPYYREQIEKQAVYV
jgi:predicted nucleotidyltransferase